MVLLGGRALSEPGQTQRCSPRTHPWVLSTHLHPSNTSGPPVPQTFAPSCFCHCPAHHCAESVKAA